MKSIFSSLFYLLFILKCDAQVSKDLEKIKFVFKNDSIVQTVVITFSSETMKMPPLEASKKIYVVINTKNTLRNLECSVSDTAFLKKNNPTSSAWDEVKHVEFSTYYYVTHDTCKLFFQLEIMEKQRLFIGGKENCAPNNKLCPFIAVGLLRKQ